MRAPSTGHAAVALSTMAILREAHRRATSHTSVWLLPVLAYATLQARLALGGGGAHGVAHGARLVHRLPALKALAPYVLGHVQAMPAVGGFALILLAEGAVLWRARREVDDLSEPFVGIFADPRSLAIVWVVAFVAFLVGTTAGLLLGPGAGGPRILLLTLPAIVLTQTVYTAQALTIWDDPRPRDSLPQALWRAAPSLPALLAWEFLLAMVFAVVLLVQSRILVHPELHTAGVMRGARLAILGVLGSRALVTWVPVVLVLERCSLRRALERTWEMWRLEPLWTAVPIVGLALVFTAYAYVGTWLATMAMGAAVSVAGLRAVLGFGALALHLWGAAWYGVMYRARLDRR